MRKMLALITTGLFTSLSAFASPCDHKHFIVENHTQHSFVISSLQTLKGTLPMNTGDVIQPGSSATWVLDSDTGSHGNIKGTVTLQHQDSPDADNITLSYSATSYGLFCVENYPKVEFNGPYTVYGELESFGLGFYVHGYRYHIKSLN